MNYGVSFLMSVKVEVNGSVWYLFYCLLVGEGVEFFGDIIWNFEKFFFGFDGCVLVCFSLCMVLDDLVLV